MLELVESTEQVLVLDDRGRLLASYPTRPEAEAFLTGYRAGRGDGAMIAAHSTDGLAARIGGGRG